MRKNKTHVLHKTFENQPPPQALHFSQGRGERETRVTGDELQGTMGRVQTLSPSRLPLPAHRRETSGYEAVLKLGQKLTMYENIRCRLY